MNRFPTGQKTIVTATLLSLALSAATPYRAFGGEHVDTSGEPLRPAVTGFQEFGPCNDFLVGAIIEGKTGFSPEGQPLVLSDKKDLKISIEGNIDPVSAELWLPQNPSTTTARGYVRLRVGARTVMYPFDFTANFPQIDGLVKLLPGGLIQVTETGSLLDSLDKFIILDPIAKLMRKNSVDDSPIPTLFSIEGSDLNLKTFSKIAGQSIYNFSFSDRDGQGNGLPSTLLMAVDARYVAGHSSALVGTNIVSGYENMVQYGSVLVGTKESKKVEESEVSAQATGLAGTIMGMFGRKKMQVVKKETSYLDSLMIVDLLDPLAAPRTLELDLLYLSKNIVAVPEIKADRSGSDKDDTLTLALAYKDEVRWIQIDMVKKSVSPFNVAKVLNDRLLPKSVVARNAEGLENTFRMVPITSLYENRFVIDVLRYSDLLKVRTTDLKTGHSYFADANAPTLSYQGFHGNIQPSRTLTPHQMTLIHKDGQYFVRLSASLEKPIPENQTVIDAVNRQVNGVRPKSERVEPSEVELREMAAIMKAAKNSGR